jgi:hypothetical protein
MTEIQRQNIYELAKRLDLIILVNGVEYRFVGDKLFKIN